MSTSSDSQALERQRDRAASEAETRQKGPFVERLLYRIFGS